LAFGPSPLESDDEAKSMDLKNAIGPQPKDQPKMRNHFPKRYSEDNSTRERSHSTGETLPIKLVDLSCTEQ
jgi:hypothetical protein